MSLRILPYVAAVAMAAISGTSVPIHAQSSSSDDTHASRKTPKSPTRYEDREIKVAIPAGWQFLPNAKGKMANSVSEAPGTLVLEKDGYRLSLGYHVGRASGIVGGRFIEAFDLNWSGLDDAWTCSLYLREYPQPASRNLVFVNLIVDSGDDKVRENCAIPRNLGSWTVKGGTKQYEGEFRWFGGYFRPAYGGYFFGPDGDGCAEKAYTFTSQATSPDRLPVADNPLPESNPALEKIIDEAIDIVNSIQYKQCSPF